MDLRHLRSFIAVADELSFRRAAAKLNLSQPPLSRQIRALEENLGVRLLERGRAQRITLTEAGESYLADARRTLADITMARERAREADRGARGLLKLANIAELSIPVLFPLLRAFREISPEVKVSLVEMMPNEQLRALEDGRIHAAICPSIGKALGRHLQSQTLFSCPMAAVFPKGHPVARASSAALDVRQLQGETLLVLSPETRPGYLEMFDALCVATDFIPTATHPVDRAENALGMVAAGYGLAILPEMVARLPVPGCEVRPLLPPAPTFRLKLIWRREAPSPLVLNFLTAARRSTGAQGRSEIEPAPAPKAP